MSDKDRNHNTSVLGDKKMDTGLKKAALEDYNKRLVVNTERKHDGSR